MNDRDKALANAKADAKDIVDGYDFTPDARYHLMALSRALLQESERCERLEVCRRLLDEVSYGINALLSGDSEEGPGHWKVTRADFPELFGTVQAGNTAMHMGVAIVEALELTALAKDANEH